MSADQMRAEIVLDRLRQDFRAAVNTLIAAGLSEEDSFNAAINALYQLRIEVLASWVRKHTRIDVIDIPRKWSGDEGDEAP